MNEMPIVRTEITLPKQLNFEQAKPQLRQVVKKTAFDLASIMQQSMRGSKSGRVYKKLRDSKRARSKKRGQRSPGDYIYHQASAPGEAPASRTGNLRTSIKPQFESALFWKVQVGAEYGAFLESGTRKMSPRPFGDPAFQQIKPIFDQAVTQVFTNLEGV